MFSELLEKFLQHFGSSISRPSRVTIVPCQTVKNGRPGRSSVDIPPEVLEDLRGLGFMWDKIARIFRVSRWTIMRRVRSFDLEHLSLFSTMSDEEIDSIIQDFINCTTWVNHRRNYTYECHNEFGHRTKYTLRDTKAPHLKPVFLGSTRFRLSLIRLLCTVYPIARECPRR